LALLFLQALGLGLECLGLGLGLEHKSLETSLPERQTILDYEARDDGVAMTLAGPYAYGLQAAATRPGHCCSDCQLSQWGCRVAVEIPAQKPTKTSPKVAELAV